MYRGEGLVDELVRRIQASVEPVTDRYEIILLTIAAPINRGRESRPMLRVIRV